MGISKEIIKKKVSIFVFLLISVSLISCNQDLSSEEIIEVENHFSFWEEKINGTNDFQTITKLQLEFDKKTFDLMSSFLTKNIGASDKEKVITTFKSQHSSINFIIYQKLNSEFTRMR